MAAQYIPRSTIYNGLLQRFQNSPIVGTVPADGARFGIVTGSAAEYARFGTVVAGIESGNGANSQFMNNNSTNLSDPGGSGGIFQYGITNNQVPGGPYNTENSMTRFVQDITGAVQNNNMINSGNFRSLFASRTRSLAAQNLSGQGTLADGPATNPDGSPKTDGTDPSQPQTTPSGTPQSGTGSGLGGAAGGQAIPINLQVLGPGTTKPITGWVDQIMKGFGQEAQSMLTAAENSIANYFGGITNWFVRGFLILLGIIIIAIGLIVLMWDHGGQQVAVNVRKAVAA